MNASNIHKELLAMSVAASMNSMNNEAELLSSKAKKGKSSRNSFTQNKSLPPQYQAPSRAKDMSSDNGD